MIGVLSPFDAFSDIAIVERICCQNQVNSKCWSSDQRVCVKDFTKITCPTGSATAPSTPQTLPNYSEVTYWYEPSSVNPQVGRGVIDGLLQYNSNDFTAPQFVYIYDNSLIFPDYASWAAALTARGITPAPLEN